MSTGWKIWKDIAYPGTVHVPGPDGSTRRYTFTAGDFARISKTGNAKIADGWSVPVCWEHQDVSPERLQLSQNPDRDFAMGVFGSIERFGRTPDGRLKALLAGDDIDDFEQLKKVRFVSPEIAWNWQDTDGRLWHGPSVTHLAATPRPVQRHQHPIGTNPDQPHPRLTRASSLESLVRMSFGNFSGGSNGARVAPTLRLSLDFYARAASGGSAMADSATYPTGGDSGTGGDKKQTPWQRIAQALEMCGVKIGSGDNVKDADHLADLVEVACLNSQENQPDDDVLPEADEENPDENEPSGDMEEPPAGATEPSAPVQMSLEAAKKQIDARDAALIESHRADLARRVTALGKRFAPAVVNPLAAEVAKVRLSLTNTLKLAANPLITKIETLEALPKDSTWNPRSPAVGKKGGKPGKKARLSVRGAAEVETSPYESGPEQSEEAAEQASDDFFAAAGVTPRDAH